MYLNVYSIPLILVAAMMLILAIITRNEKTVPGTNYFSLLMFAGALYSLFYGLEISSGSLQLVSVFYRLQYIAIPFIPALFLLFALSYTSKKDISSLPLIILILIVPVVTMILALTSGMHDLYISGEYIDDQGLFPIVLFERRAGYLVHQVYSFCAILFGIILFFRMWLASAPAFRRQIGIILAGSFIPFVSYILYLLESFPPGFDVNPFSFAATGILFFTGITRFRLFRLAPLARNMLFDSIPDGVVVLDRHYRLLDFNLSASSVFNIGSHDIGKPSGEVFKNWPEILIYMTESGKNKEFEISRITENNLLFLNCYFTRLRNERRFEQGQMLIVRDVTGQRKAEIEKDESEEKFRIIFENAPVGLMYFDKDGIIEICNDDFARILGSTEDKLNGLNLTQLPDERLVNVVMSAFRGKGGEFEGVFINQKDKNSVYVRAVSKPVFSANNVVEGGLCIIEDITMRMAGDENIKRTNAELKRLNAEKDKFFSILAHDLRSPFSAFLGFTDIMVEGIESMPPGMIKSLGVSMRESANNLYSLLENLLLWSRMQQESISFNQEELIIKDKVLSCIEPLLISSNNKVIDVRYDIPEGLYVYADMKMFEMVIRNLFSNAVKFTPKEGSIIISAYDVDNDYVEIKFRDTGIGMSSEMVENLFRLDVKSSRPGTEGELSTGLGLILCKDFIEINGGSIRVESQQGEGSSFYVSLMKRATGKHS